MEFQHRTLKTRERVVRELGPTAWPDRRERISTIIILRHRQLGTRCVCRSGVRPQGITAQEGSSEMASTPRNDWGFRTTEITVLAEYIISQGRFENPYNRAPLTREDCVRLDEHCQRLAASRLGDVVHREVCVTAAYDLQQSMRLHKTDGSESANQLALSLRREAATALLHLFQFRRTTRQDRRISSRNRQRELRQPSTSAAEANLRGGWAPGEEPHPGPVPFLPPRCAMPAAHTASGAARTGDHR
eukprot:69526-Rhodomonas_salina.3